MVKHQTGRQYSTIQYSTGKVMYKNKKDLNIWNIIQQSYYRWPVSITDCLSLGQCCLSLSVSGAGGDLRLRAAREAEVSGWLSLTSLPVACLMFILNLLISLLAVVRSL